MGSNEDFIINRNLVGRLWENLGKSQESMYNEPKLASNCLALDFADLASKGMGTSEMDI